MLSARELPRPHVYDGAGDDEAGAGHNVGPQMAPRPAPPAPEALATAFSSKDPVLQSEGNEDGDGSGQVELAH